MINTLSSTTYKIVQPRINIEKALVLVAIVALAIAIIGVVALQVHFPGVGSFMNLSSVKIGLTAGGGTVIIAALLTLAIKGCTDQRKKSHNLTLEDISVLEEDNDTESPQEMVKSRETYLEEVDNHIKELQDELKKASFHFLSYPSYTLNCYSPYAEKTHWQVLQSDKEKWEEVELRIKKDANKAYPILSKNLDIQWVTGTRSPMLIGLDQYAEKNTTYALVPTGALLSQNIVPLTGELFQGISTNGINQTMLSGVRMFDYHEAKEYADNNDFKFDPTKEKQLILNFNFESYNAIPLARIRVAVLRLLHMGASKEELKQIKNHLKENVFSNMISLPRGWESHVNLIGEEADNKEIGIKFKKGDIVIFQDDGDYSYKYGLVLRKNKDDYEILMDKKGKRMWIEGNKLWISSKYNKKSRKKVKETKEIKQIREMMTEKINEKQALKEILSLFKSNKPISLTEKDKKYLEEPFPIVWGSTTPLKLTKVRSDYHEVGFEGILPLGSKIDVAFTKKKKVKELRSWLDARNLSSVTVMSFGAARYIQARAKIQQSD